MCLDRLHIKGKTLKIEKEGNHNIGWRLFSKINGRLHPIFQGTGPFKVGVWLNEFGYRYQAMKTKDSKIYMTGSQNYSLGFHIFLKEKDAEQYSAKECVGSEPRKVYFRKVVASGNQGLYEYDCVVAKEMFIIPLRGIE